MISDDYVSFMTVTFENKTKGSIRIQSDQGYKDYIEVTGKYLLADEKSQKNYVSKFLIAS